MLIHSHYRIIYLTMLHNRVDHDLSWEFFKRIEDEIELMMMKINNGFF